MKRVVMLFAVLALAAGAFTGCNTAEGVGEDVERAGEKIKDAAD